MACDPCERGSVLAIGVGQIGAHPSLSQFPLPKSCWIVPCTGAHGETEPGSNLLGVHHRGAKIAVQPSVTLGGHYAPTFTVAFVLDPDWRRRKFKDYRAHRPRPVMEGGKKCSIEKGTLPALSRTAIFRILRSSFSPPLEFCGRTPRPRNPFGSSHRDGPKPYAAGASSSDSSDATNPISGLAGKYRTARFAAASSCALRSPSTSTWILAIWYSLLFAILGLPGGPR